MALVQVNIRMPAELRDELRTLVREMNHRREKPAGGLPFFTVSDVVREWLEASAKERLRRSLCPHRKKPGDCTNCRSFRR